MGFVRTTWHASASAVITIGFFLVPYSGALWPDFETEFMPMGGHDSVEVSLAAVNIDDLLAKENREGETTQELSNQENPDATDSKDGTSLDVEIVAVADPDASASMTDSVQSQKTMKISATRAGQAEQKQADKTIKDSPRKKGKTCKKSGSSYDITRHSTTSYSINEDLVDHYTGSLEAAAELGLVAWHTNDQGKRDGFIIRRLPCNSPLRAAGFRKGDVVHSINGKKVRSYAQGLAAWRILRKRASVEIVMTKKSGKRRRVTYSVS